MEMPWRGLESKPLNRQKAWALAENLHQATAAAFPKSVNGNKIQACTQKSDEPVHNYCNWVQIIFKENSGLPADVSPIRDCCIVTERITVQVLQQVWRARFTLSLCVPSSALRVSRMYSQHY